MKDKMNQNTHNQSMLRYSWSRNKTTTLILMDKNRGRTHIKSRSLLFDSTRSITVTLKIYLNLKTVRKMTSSNILQTEPRKRRKKRKKKKKKKSRNMNRSTTSNNNKNRKNSILHNRS
jgi:hypothetical protein